MNFEATVRHASRGMGLGWLGRLRGEEPATKVASTIPRAGMRDRRAQERGRSRREPIHHAN
jgi:hypothetical protein